METENNEKNDDGRTTTHDNDNEHAAVHLPVKINCCILKIRCSGKPRYRDENGTRRKFSRALLINFILPTRVNDTRPTENGDFLENEKKKNHFYKHSDDTTTTSYVNLRARRTRRFPLYTGPQQQFRDDSNGRNRGALFFFLFFPP